MSKPLAGQKKVTTVWLETEERSFKNRLKFFHCFNCRIPVFQYKGNVVSIVPGAVPYEPYSEHKCKGNVLIENGVYEQCGQFYIIAGVVHTENPEMTG